MKTLFKDPADVLKLSKEELVKSFAKTCALEEEVLSQKKALKDVLFDKIEGSGEIVGNHSIVKAKRIKIGRARIWKKGGH